MHHFPDALALVVGPEGGLSDVEVSALAGEGAAVVSFGPRILRSETAGLVAATIVLHAYGSLG
jgi:16S rRNA (uracil1498-N3)-methyltransferase